MWLNNIMQTHKQEKGYDSINHALRLVITIGFCEGWGDEDIGKIVGNDINNRSMQIDALLERRQQ